MRASASHHQDLSQAAAPTESADNVPCHVEHEYAGRTTASYSGADHIVLDGPLHHGRLRRDVGDALCKERRRFRDLKPTDADRRASCVTCLRQAQRIAEVGMLAAPSGGQRTSSGPCLAWRNDSVGGGMQADVCQRCDHRFADHSPGARLADWFELAAYRSAHGLEPLVPPWFIAAELAEAAH